MKRLITIIFVSIYALLACVTSSAQSQISEVGANGEPSREMNSGSGGNSRGGSLLGHKHAKEPANPSYAWGLIAPLGLHTPAPMDTTMYNYFQIAIPSSISPAFATTGAQTSAGENMIYMDREPMSDFFLADAKRFWIPKESSVRFYNTRIPISDVSYSTGGGRDFAQDYFRFMFSGNISKKAQIGLFVNYPYSKGMYNHQASKGYTWGIQGSYIGDRYEAQAYTTTYTFLNQENGGITDDLYILDPAVVQGGLSKIAPRSIPTFLSNSSSRVKGKQIYLNQRYKVGFWREQFDSIKTDSVVAREYVPVSSFIWTFSYQDGTHKFTNSNGSQENYWQNHYISDDGTWDRTSYSSIRNTIGISLLEGFNKYAKAGLAAFVTHEYRKYHQTIDTIPMSGPDRPAGLTPYPFEQKLAPNDTENRLYVGAQLTKQQGRLLNYEVTGRIGLIGAAVGEVDVKGNVSTHLKLLGDTVSLVGYGHFSNSTAPYLMKHFVSNHFMWENDFSKIRRLRFGGVLDIPQTGTNINVGVENVQNLIYFGNEGLPIQHGGSIQVFSARLQQNLRFRAFNWNNTVIYQTSAKDEVLPLPKFAVYSNMYLLFRVAKVLHVQFGVDLNYYSSYYAPNYQPSTMTFCNQREVKVGNYPFMNAYLNMKMKRATFYVLFSHVNQGIFGGKNYFSLPHYPLDPRRFLMGVRVNFLN